MVEISFEYVEWNEQEVDSIHILCSTEESIFFTFFYSINGNVVARHKVNGYLNKKADITKSLQSAADKIGIKDLQNIIALFTDNNQEVPNLIKISYYPPTKKFETDFDYKKRLTGTDLMEEDLVEEWMISLSN